MSGSGPHAGLCYVNLVNLEIILLRIPFAIWVCSRVGQELAGDSGNKSEATP